MRKFFKYVFASMVGFVLAGGVLLALFFGGIFAIINTAKNELKPNDKEVVVKSNSVYHLKFNQQIGERAGNNPFENMDLGPFSTESKMSLRNIVQSIEYAATDDNIKGIFIELDGFPGGLSKLEEVRNALLDFKESGKWVVTFGESFSQGGYYIASVSDKVYLYPEGNIWFKGLATNIMYMKGLFEKMDIEMQAIKGPNNIYKSAVEPFTADKMSDANREQIQAYLSSIWGHWLKGISKQRGISVEKLDMYADSLTIRNPEAAEELGLVDGLKYRDEVIAEILDLVEVEKEKDMHFVTYSKYKKKKAKTRKEGVSRKDTKKVAVIYAEGEIRSGKNSDGVMGSESIAKAIKKARLDTNVKAIVLRVNSPGGSALASDVMWRETELAKKEKPFIVSMGDLAASGGYFISCGADKIYASETSITGSIGVFGMMPVTEKFFKNKLGIIFETEQTNTHSKYPNGVSKLDQEAYDVINESIIDIYDDFISKVAAGRGMTKEQVNEVARGRVWTGADAVEIGLVDEIGGLDDAIAYAVEQANLDGYKLKELPELKDPIDEFIKNLQSEMSVKYLKSTFGDSYKYFNIIDNVQNMKGIQARMPYVIEFY
ncbi:signal peptide peptidase SppA [bacterium SCSIO 12643]|nr:signal peptide peptidase SppA [bacterium SCSIO 12643]